MDERLFNALSALGVPVRKFVYEDKEVTHITFFNVLEQGELRADNRERYTGYYYQVDLWSKNDIEIAELYDKVHGALLAAGFERQDKQEFYESDTQIYHYAVRVSIGEKAKVWP